MKYIKLSVSENEEARKNKKLLAKKIGVKIFYNHPNKGIKIKCPCPKCKNYGILLSKDNEGREWQKCKKCNNKITLIN